MKKVLIVEDDPMVALINRKYTELIDGFSVIDCVDNEKDVLQVLKNEKVDLIIMDVYLPKKNGLEILKSLRDNMYLVDVIMVTAANGVEQVRNAFAYGVVDYLIKPFEFDRFKEAIDKYLEKQNILNKNQKLKQNEVDTLVKSDNKETLPKGIQKKTLDTIVEFLKCDFRKVWTIREIAQETKISNVTIKKYMDYLEECKKIESSPVYGNVGRPEYKYRLVE